jgi:hypothetical protein
VQQIAQLQHAAPTGSLFLFDLFSPSFHRSLATDFDIEDTELRGTEPINSESVTDHYLAVGYVPCSFLLLPSHQ